MLYNNNFENGINIYFFFEKYRITIRINNV